MSITLGTKKTVDASGNDNLNIQKFSSSDGEGIELYSDSGLRARYLAISGATITTPVIDISVDAGFTDLPFATVFVEEDVIRDLILVVYRQGANTAARIISNVTSTLSVKSATTLTEVAEMPSLTLLSSTAALLVYKNASTGAGRAVILSIDLTTFAVTENTIVTFSEVGTTIYMPDVTVLTSIKAVVAWIGQLSGNNPMAVVLTVSGTTITVQTALQLDGSNIGFTTTDRLMAVSAFNSTIMMYVYRRSAAAAFGAILTESSNTLSEGGVASVSSGSPEEFDLVTPDGITAVYTEGKSGNLNVVQITRTGTTLSVFDTDSLAVTTPGSVYAAVLSASSILIGFDGSAEAIVATLTTAVTRIWKRSTAGAWSDISDSSWPDPVRAIYVKPGLDDDTIWVAVGTGIYLTENGGTSWTLKATLTFEPEGIDGLPADDGIIAYTKDAAGTNRFAIITDTTVVYRDSGHSTTGKGTIARGVA